MTDKQLIKDVLELLQLIHTSHHTLLPTNPPRDPWVYHKVSWKIEDMATRLNNKLRAETEQPEQKPWVGLTDEEVSQLIGKEIGFNSCCGWEHEYTRAVEAKIKEKNR